MGVFDTSAQGLLGKALRLPLKVIPTGKIIPILQGPMKGTKWIIGSSPHSCWLGVGEREKLSKFVKTVKPGDIVYVTWGRMSDSMQFWRRAWWETRAVSLLLSQVRAI